jgi:hypothetical protein
MEFKKDLFHSSKSILNIDIDALVLIIFHLSTSKISLSHTDKNYL